MANQSVLALFGCCQTIQGPIDKRVGEANTAKNISWLFGDCKLSLSSTQDLIPCSVRFFDRLILVPRCRLCSQRRRKTRRTDCQEAHWGTGEASHGMRTSIPNNLRANKLRAK